MATIILNSFNAGELSPLLSGRTDIAKYFSGCQTLENMIVLSYGGATRRPGTKYIATAGNTATAVRLIPFEFSSTQTYIIEMGNLYMRFYKDGAQILSGGSAYQITTVFTTAELFDIKFVQSADEMYLVHPNHPPQQLTRTGHTSWTIADYAYEDGPFLDENETTTTTITPSGTTGSITLTASADVFDSDMVGALFRIRHDRNDNSLNDAYSSVTNSSAIPAKGRWEFTTHGTWDGTMVVQRSLDSGVSWQAYRTYSAANDRNILTNGEEVNDDAQYRVAMTVFNSGECQWEFHVQDFYYTGVVEITAVASATSATATVVSTLGDTGATWRWSEGSWSPYRGYPSCVALFEERLVFASNSNEPQTLWFSQTNDWPNFEKGELDTDALIYTIASDQVNVIRWLVAQTQLLIGTVAAEFTLGASSADEAVTPTNVNASRQSSYGNQNVQAASVNNVVLFLQRQGRKIRELVYSFAEDNYVAPDMTVLSEHITESGILNMAFQKTPDPMLWCVRDDGVLAAMTYMREQEVIAWHRHTTDGEFESVAVIPGSAEDEVWVSVKRTINGSDTRYIEQFQPRDWGGDQEDAFMLDSGLAFDGGAAVTITNITQADPGVVTAAAHGFSDGDQVRISGVVGMTEVNNRVFSVSNPATNTFELRGADDSFDWDTTAHTAYSSGGTVRQVENRFTTLNHLNGETVTIVADGAYIGTARVSSNTVTLADHYNTVRIGLPYTSKLLPMRLESPTERGTAQGRVKRITEVTIRFHDTARCLVGTSWTEYEEVAFREASDLLEESVPLYTGDRTIDFAGDYNDEGYIYIQNDRPLPMTIIAVIPTFEVY
jgi:hypothetical protein